MTWPHALLLAALVGVVALASVAAAYVRRRCLDRWLPSYVATRRARRARRPGEPVHVLLCVADHYEPNLGDASAAVADARVERWVNDYPKCFSRFRDSDGRPPRHSFFYPLEVYDAAHIDRLAQLCRAGFGEVEVHLHHDRETAESLRRRLLDYKQILDQRHQLLARDRRTGEVKYGFIHGNWALDNSRPDGRWCGVTNELEVLRETGCYADFTLPSAPSPTQTRQINSIYYARGDACRCKAHDRGTPVGSAPQPPDSLMLIQGPLLLDWKRRKYGLLPRIENACLQHNQAPSLDRLGLWLQARVHVPNRPEWLFVKLHTHGAPEWNQRVLLGEPTVRFHESLVALAEEDRNFHFHYVTAREMYNLARAAEAGETGDVRELVDYELAWNGAHAAAPTQVSVPAITV